MPQIINFNAINFLFNMSHKNKNKIGVVYSTDPNFNYEFENTSNETETIAPEKQVLKVSIDRKHRNGKEATLIEGFVGKTLDLEELGKKIKTQCGVGGAVKDGIVIVQGNFKDRVVALLQSWGYAKTKGK